ncbi:MAG: thermonuclease family protein [Nitrosarchaeum sp.]|nr:thermonuclease family protein [Nitrosarchaeum sp.]
MKSLIIIAIIVVGVIGAVAVFAAISPTTWQDNRPTFQGDTRPDENKEKIDCLSKGGLWTGNSCSIPDFAEPTVINCTGNCITEKVTRIVDGDTIYTANHKIRLSLTNTPEKDKLGFQEATLFTVMHCPVDSMITVDQDDLQPFDQYGRMLGKVYCEGGVINEMLLSNGHANILTQYCDTSEFSGESWAQKYGCKEETLIVTPVIIPKETLKTSPEETPKVIPKETLDSKENCDPSYPDVCILPYPPDLDCGDISYKNFRVMGSDPHRFDGDKDGIGCEK